LAWCAQALAAPRLRQHPSCQRIWLYCCCIVQLAVFMPRPRLTCLESSIRHGCPRTSRPAQRQRSRVGQRDGAPPAVERGYNQAPQTHSCAPCLPPPRSDASSLPYGTVTGSLASTLQQAPACRWKTHSVSGHPKYGSPRRRPFCLVMSGAHLPGSFLGQF